MLTLPIKKQWFDMIAKGEKKEEYREIKPYYEKRFVTAGLLDFWTDDHAPAGREIKIAFRNGYGYCSPTMYVSVTLTIGEGKPEWGGRTEQKILCASH